MAHFYNQCAFPFSFKVICRLCSPRNVHAAQIGGHGTDIQLTKLCGERSKYINLQQGQMPSRMMDAERRVWAGDMLEGETKRLWCSLCVEGSLFFY